MRAIIRMTSCLLLVCYENAAAQLGFLDKVFENVTNINAYLMLGRSLGTSDLLKSGKGSPTLRGEGVEVSIDLGDAYRRKLPKQCTKDPEYEFKEPKERQIVRKAGGARDTVDVYLPKVKSEEPAKECRATPAIPLQLSLGYSVLSGFRGNAVDMRASLEELPSLSLYAQLEMRSWIEPYLGIRGGLIQLKGARMFVGDTLVTGSGSTYQIGIAPGLVVGDPKGEWGLFVEAALTYRKFHSIDWAYPAAAFIPAAARTEAKFSTLTVLLGGSIGFGQGKAKS